METRAHDGIEEILRRTSAGEGTFPELARALQSLEKMNLIVPPAELGRFMEDLQGALEEKGYGNVMTSDAESPRFDGLVTPQGGFVPRIFTDGGLAREYAVTSGLVEPDGNLFFQTMPWVSGLHQFLTRGYAGVIIDAGSDHEINLERAPLARLLAVMTIEEFARLETLCLVARDGKMHFQPSADGKRVHAFVFDGPSTAELGAPRISDGGERLETPQAATANVLDVALRNGVTHLIVNPSLADERFYTTDEMIQMLEILGVEAPPAGEQRATALATGGPALSGAAADSAQARTPDASPSDPVLAPSAGAADAASSGAAELPEPMQRALRHPKLPMVPVPEVSDAASRGVIERWEPIARAGEADPWQLVEAVGFELKAYVPLHHRNVEGLHWPQFFRSPDESKPEETVIYLFSERARVEEALRTSTPDRQGYLELSGIEALRWAWATPGPVHNLGIDWPDREASFYFPMGWARGLLFPHFHPVRDLRKVPEVAAREVTSIPGARGGKPEVVRCLIEHWKHLLEVAIEGSEVPYSLRDEAGTWLPVFTSQEAFFQHNISVAGFQGRPTSPGKTPPFERWVRACCDLDGVVLDPAGPHPVRLEPLDLVHLYLWHRSGSQPDAWSLVNECGRLVGRGVLSQTQAARLAAGIPFYIIGMQPDGEGGAGVLQIPDSDTGALFTDAHAWDVFTNWHEEIGLLTEAMKPLGVESRWDRNGLAFLMNNFSAIHINPGPLYDGGLYLESGAFEAGLRGLDAILKPRIPRFVWGEED